MQSPVTTKTESVVLLPSRAGRCMVEAMALAQPAVLHGMYE